jgi:uncharacterized protein YdeI (YjbR/CyaY-like superfamily)
MFIKTFSKTKTRKDSETHKLPIDFKIAIFENEKVKTQWENITDNAKKNWICWILDAKKEETRKRRIAIAISKLSSCTKRPCCFQGCKH